MTGITSAAVISSQTLSARASAPNSLRTSKRASVHRASTKASTIKASTKRDISCSAASMVDMSTPTSYILLKPGFPLKWMDKWANPYTHMPRQGGRVVSEQIKSNIAAAVVDTVAPIKVVKSRSIPATIALKIPKKWMDNWVKEQQLADASSTSFAPMVTVQEAKLLLEREGYKLVDLRNPSAFDEKHIVKPAHCSFNVSCTKADAVFIDGVNHYFPKSSKIVIMDHSGALVQEAADALHKAGFTNVKAMEGGFEGWLSRFTNTGRKQPAKGKWVSSGPTVLTLDDEDLELKHEELWALDVDIDGV